MLGERPDWILDVRTRLPSYESGQRIVEVSAVDHCWSVDFRCVEHLRIYEQRTGARGVQLVDISGGSLPGERPEGSELKLVRVFDGDRAISIPLGRGAARVAVIGVVDLAPLDLLASSHYLAARARDVATARALIAQLLAEVDAHFDTSPAWPEGPAREGLYAPSFQDVQSFVDGSRAVTVARDPSDNLLAQASGLAWGQGLVLQLSGTSGYLQLRFASAELDRIEERLRVLEANPITPDVSWP